MFARSVLGLVQRGDRLFAHCVGESQVLVFDTGTTPPRPLPPIEVSAVVESIELDQDALTIALLDGRLLTYQVTSLRLTQVRQRPQPTQPLARPNITRTSYARITVLFGGIPGLISEFGGERTPIEGLWLAGGLRIANNILTLYIPAVRLYTNIGYGWHSFALGAHLSLGGGYPYPIVSAEAGLAMRFGAIDETHVRLTLSYGIGAILDLTVLVPIGQRHWLDFSLRGDGSLLYGGLALGAQHLLGRGRGFLTWGIGGAFLYPIPSALLQLGYVSRR